MYCPRCGKCSRVVDSRIGKLDDGDSARWRRRRCEACGHRFTTWEGYEKPDFDAERKVSAVARIVTGKVSGAGEK